MVPGIKKGKAQSTFPVIKRIILAGILKAKDQGVFPKFNKEQGFQN